MQASLVAVCRDPIRLVLLALDLMPAPAMLTVLQAEIVVMIFLKFHVSPVSIANTSVQ